MSEERQSIHGEWSSQTVFILAAAGSAIGLGNIWKFPYITGENGGGAFVLVYLLCILIIGLPVMIGEILIGRRGRQNPAHSVAYLAEEAKASSAWSAMGYMGMLASFLILTFYVVIAGWSFAYIFVLATGDFNGASADQVGESFDNFLASPLQLMFWSALVVGSCVITIAGGVKKGIERAVRWLMPGMIGILLILVGYALRTDSFQEGFNFLFKPDFTSLTANGVLVALGHAFFTLSLASGTMMAYGAYLPKNTSIVKVSISVAAADTLIALLAGLAIFPIVFAYDLEPSAGPGLIFVTLPIAFGQMPFGAFFGGLFFVMLSLAAFTSAISLLEPTVSWLIERFNLSRLAGVSIAGAILWIASLGTVFSFNLWSDVKLFDRTIFDNLDYLTANIMLPLGGLAVAVFTSWIMKSAVTRNELELGDSALYTAWSVIMRFIAPVLIVIVFLNAIGVLSFGS